MKIDLEFLRSLIPPAPSRRGGRDHGPGTRAEQIRILEMIAPTFQETLEKYADISTPLRMAHFLGQSMEESDNYSTLTEYASGAEYNGRKDLGNLRPGDGPRFKGRTPFQLTGRANYKKVGEELGIDLISNPDLALQMPWAMAIPATYWKDHRLNQVADIDDIEHMTRLINGGYRGFKVRIINTNKAKQSLGIPVTDYKISKAGQAAIRSGR